ncbi:MAG: AAA family ATPase [Flavobacterium sp.]|nr:MAG: AAA family ATPase [Flavobacterium sp.]
MEQILKEQRDCSKSINTLKMPLPHLFAEQGTPYLNVFNLYLAYFSSIPDSIQESEINCRQVVLWMDENYRDTIIDCHYSKRYFNGTHPELDDIIYVCADELLVCVDVACDNVRFLFRKTAVSKVQEITAGIQKFKIKPSKKAPKLSLVIISQKGLELKTLPVKKPKLHITDNYNDDFFEIHKLIIKRLSRKNEKGLILLHGKPGTGKTSYIRYLMASVQKKVIFLPPNMASAITNPNLISILIDNPNSIFVIEDAENIVVDREQDGASPVSALLNISDGLLSDCLNVQIICSFNTDISRIDDALLRKGRLIAKYEFKDLTIDKAQGLSNKLGFKSLITVPMTLASIYGQEEKEFWQSGKPGSIGFSITNKQTVV